ncbi:hypothetical protein CXG81DRAFT_12475 [Caulochytrium protostelioides]|uniref:DNA mismatch repair protein S5 domain-containing protein n=1 Tax=Caulochytrium protostelioides TaxID=1555241 RepID=A0A4V1IUM3_9FUNG|nr:hypothetical protein CXG81DRAFT_12475 [Caulochytrium protostelioides]|eukprot:RKP01059.1 hypothetical protein CXG81DRAFT_12475 [Caulochytrium protostelioides]
MTSVPRAPSPVTPVGDATPAAGSAADGGRIRPLPSSVVHRIAAGEVVPRASHAVKELLENSLDAGSTQIDVTLTQGGLKRIQIKDNGHGIHRADFPRVCERYATSKLREYASLASGQVATFGFRGEALASVSHVARLVEVVSKTPGARCAFRGKYAQGQLLDGGPTPCAGNDGTIITIDDLFHHVSLRQRAFETAAAKTEEYQRCLVVLQHYALAYPHVGFSCRRTTQAAPDLLPGDAPGAARTDRIGAIYGPRVAQELVWIYEHADDRVTSYDGAPYAWSCEGFVRPPSISAVAASASRGRWPLFINGRLVTCRPLQRAIDRVYAPYLPKGHAAFLGYLHLRLPPSHVDVNVHPTKREVIFLNEETVVEAICQALEQKLASWATGRRFDVRQMPELPSMADYLATASPAKSTHQTDTATAASAVTEATALGDEAIGASQPRTPAQMSQRASQMLLAPPGQSIFQTASGTLHTSPPTEDTDLDSVHELRAELADAAHPHLTHLFRNLVHVGTVDDQQVLWQHETSLYLVQLPRVAVELFYALALLGFGRFGLLQLSPPIPLPDAADTDAGSNMPSDAMLRHTLGHVTVEHVPDQLTTLFDEKAEMLKEYFGMTILPTDALSQPQPTVNAPVEPELWLASLPVLLNEYTPPLHKLPLFLLRCLTQVDWTDEKMCFRTLCHEIALFYTPEPTPDVWLFPPKTASASAAPSSEPSTGDTDLAVSPFAEQTRRILAPAIQRYAFAPRRFANDGTLLRIADLPDLYRVFERCS